MKPKLKVCGITQKSQALEISNLDVDALGFILYPPSKRNVHLDEVKDIVYDLPPYLKTVGVVVNESIEDIIQISHTSKLDLIQLHGEESPNFCHELTRHGVDWIKVFRVQDDFDFSILAEYPSHNFLLDAWSDQEYGGTGEKFDWEQIAGLSQENRIVLAGGITPENVTEAIQKVQPYGIDISSGVEESPGIKSIEKVKALIKTMESTHSTGHL